MRSVFCTMVARVPWEHEAQFESDVFNRGILSIGNNESKYLSCACTNVRYLDEYPPRTRSARGRCWAHIPEAAGSNPAPATQNIMKKEKRNNAIYGNDKKK